MSPPSYSAASPAPLISDMDVVIVYDSEGEEFEHRRQAELSAVVVGSLEAPRQAKFHPAVPQLVAGDAEGVPPLQQIPQVEVTAEEFARALARARSPLTLEWCQNEAPCVLCVQRGEACVFGLRHDTSVCLPCRTNHEKCSISLEWQAACIAAEQGWDEDWVRSQLGEARRTQTLGEASSGRSVGQVEPPQGGRREGASLAADCGKRRAFLLSGARPSKRPQGYEPMAGFPGFHVHSPTPDGALGWASSSPEPPPSITEVFLCKRVEVLMAALMAWEGELWRVREDPDAAWAEKEALEQAWNTSVRGAPEQVPQVRGLRERLTQQEGQPTEEVEEWEMAPEAGLLWAELEVARWREDWLANKAASGRVGILRWVREHQVLLDGAFAAFALIQDGLAQMPVGQPPELQQGMARVGRLLAGHQRHNAVALGLWWEVAADAGEALPGLVEVLAVVWAQMEIDLGVGMVGVLGEE
ncbi:hypothetical protein E4T56_gene11032 [Termitomyces sp. T112]|nr:hypothetical protein E4T56_gene11032 [Termitomyces sp. T112]